MPDRGIENSSLVSFFILTFVLTSPLYLMCFFAMRTETVPDGLAYLSLILCTLAPISSGLILTWRANGRDAAKRLLARALDHRRVTGKFWLVPTFILPPLVYLAALAILILMGESIPSAKVPFVALPAVFLLFVLMAACEEVGWMGYAFDPMQKKWSPLLAATLLGLIWAAWHVPFFLLVMDGIPFIAAMIIAMLSSRFLMVRVYTNAGESVLLMILLHAVGNTAHVLLPNDDVATPLGALLTSGLFVLTAILVWVFWRPKTPSATICFD